MSSKLPAHAVNQMVTISPECLSIANTYLKYTNIDETARCLGIPKENVVAILNKREVQDYVDSVFLETGYRNRFTLGETLDTLIQQKLIDLAEAGTSSNKDIADLLALAHKFRMDELKQRTAHMVAETRAGAIKNQVNVQINESPYGSGNYGALLDKLLNGPV